MGGGVSALEFRCPQRPEESDLPIAGVTGGCGPPHWGCWESASGLQEEQYMLSTAEHLSDPCAAQVLTINLTQPRVTWEENLNLDQLGQWVCLWWVCLWWVVLVVKSCRKTPHTEGGTIP